MVNKRCSLKLIDLRQSYSVLHQCRFWDTAYIRTRQPALIFPTS